MKIEKDKARLRREYHRQKHTHICSNCGKTLYNYHSNAQKYCGKCSANIKLENARLRRVAYYKKWKDVLPATVGTGWLSNCPRNTVFDDTDFKNEFLAVKREKKRLGLDKP
jgi:ribosomal protein S27AE